MIQRLLTTFADRIAFIVALFGGMHRPTALLARFDLFGRPKDNATTPITEFTNILVKDERGQAPRPIRFKHGSAEQTVVEATHLRLGDSVVIFALAHRTDRPAADAIVHVLCWDFNGKQMRYVLASVAKDLKTVLPRYQAQ